MIRKIDKEKAYKYSDVKENLQIVGVGGSLDQAIERVTNGVCATVADLDVISQTHEERVRVEAESLTRAIYEFLNLVIAQMRERSFFVKHVYYLAITQSDNHFVITAQLVGEKGSDLAKSLQITQAHHVGMTLEMVEADNLFEAAVLFSLKDV